ncbi:MAG: hypothetical protein LBP65_00710 [Puniceicoccales bacterium]|nr:hypothetical protein [Puniceicoccales bacterium]
MGSARARQFFGTDGIRGTVGGPVVNGKFFSRLGIALRRFLLADRSKDRRPRLLIGHDTRHSAPTLRSALLRGLGNLVEVLDGGVLPTPLLAHGVRLLGCDACAVLTASHNGAGENGIKLLRTDGGKWTVDAELRLESLLIDRDREGDLPMEEATAADCRETILSFYQKNIWERFFPKNALSGMLIALDCANGAASFHAAAHLQALGAKVFSTACTPDGYNINARSGSEHPASIIRHTLAKKADWGLALDGDGDRALICDGDGRLISGEQILALLALEGWRMGLAKPDIAVTTELANGALDAFLKTGGVDVLRTAVGDRAVAEAMETWGSCLGGEPSGHVLVPALGPLADGLAVGALFLSCVRQVEGTAWRFVHRPGGKKNILVATKIPLAQLPGFCETLHDVEHFLKNRGSVRVRYSGTESVLRLHVEADDPALVQPCLARLEVAYGEGVARGSRA